MGLPLRYSSIIAAIAGAAALSLAAQAASTKPKAAEKPSGTIALSVTNARSVALVELDATRVGAFLPTVILRNLAPGKTAPAKLNAGEDCKFDLRGAYTDGSKTESLGVDVCADKNVKLVD